VKPRRRRSRRPPQTSAPAAVGPLFTRTELAGLLGVNPVTITKWQGEGLPVAVRGGRGVESKYRMADIWKWGLGRERARAGLTGGAGDLSLPLERAKLARVQTRRGELEVRKREGELLEAADVGRTWSLMVLAIRAKLLALPQAVAERLVAAAAGEQPAAAVEAELAGEVRDALRELAGWKGPEAESAPVPAEAVAS